MTVTIMSRNPRSAPVLSRRTLLAAGFAAGAGTAGLAGCSSSSDDDNSGERNAAAVLPTYRPVAIAKPDLPGTETVMPGYYRYPTNLKRVIDSPPGAGLDTLSILYPTYVPAPPPAPGNRFLAQLQERVGAELKITFAPAPDYPTKFQTVVAGGDLPDLMTYVPSPDQPKMTAKLFADLGPYLAGNAAQDFPYLANFPTASWRPTVVNGTVAAVPLPRSVAGTALYGRLDLVRAAGSELQPGSLDEFTELLRSVTDASRSRWAFANTVNMIVHLQMMLGAPNGWSAKGGTFTNGWGDERTKEAVSRTAAMVKEGLFHPDSAGIAYTRIRELFFAGRVALTSDGYAGWDLFVRSLGGGAEGTAKLGLIAEPKADGGGDARHFSGTGIQSINVIKAGLGEERTRKILSVLNFLAAPIGSQEYLDRKFGVEGTDYTVVDGVPTLTDKGSSEFLDVQYISDAPTILGPGVQDGVDRQYAWHRRVTADLVRDPSVGLYSDTMSRKGATLATAMNDAITAIVFGRQPLSSFDEAYARWRSGGGDTIASELAESQQQVGG